MIEVAEFAASFFVLIIYVATCINAPNDGRNASGPVVAPTLALTSKLNSDATGMRYQWGRKDPFTYATSSERRGSGSEYGKYATKIYTIDGVLIYQVENGSDNTDKSPLGGVISQGSSASSMMTTITNPITYYGNPVVNQEGYSSDLYDYYWTSYSRGVDGRVNTTTWASEPSWHNAYLDGYIPLRVKSIYDPCPYLYRIPSNGTFNQFKSNPGWTKYSYLGGVSWNMATLGESWIAALGYRNIGSSIFHDAGYTTWYRSGTSASQTNGYYMGIYSSTVVSLNYNGSRSYGLPVRCIEGSLR